VKLPPYEMLVEDLAIKVCSEECSSSTGDQHWDGFTRADAVPTVHWRMKSRWSDLPRKSTRKGVYKFLKLTHRARNDMSKPAWQRVYEESQAASQGAKRYGIRFDRRSIEDDRTRVRFLLRDPEDREGELAQKAWRWAEKRYD
jgi:hypothetical protein